MLEEDRERKLRRGDALARTLLAIGADILGTLLILALVLGLRFGPGYLALARSASAQPQPSMVPIPRATTEAQREPTPWQRRFAEHFSDTPVLTDSSYRSPEVSVEITTHERVCDYGIAHYYVADIYVAGLENFKTATANGQLAYTAVMDARELDAQANAILAINGDFLSLNDSGFYVRNGEVYRSDAGREDICVLYPDGSMETLPASAFSVEDILARKPEQVWQFGPALLDGSGRAREELAHFANSVGMENPRAALGYYEPGHYCFVVVDGRNESSVGIRLLELGRIFEELGCRCAYNMDGGGSTVLLFNHEIYNDRSSRRTIGDLILVTEAGFPRAGRE